MIKYYAVYDLIRVSYLGRFASSGEAKEEATSRFPKVNVVVFSDLVLRQFRDNINFELSGT